MFVLIFDRYDRELDWSILKQKILKIDPKAMNKIDRLNDVFVILPRKMNNNCSLGNTIGLFFE